jgi:hypothetical protein
MGGGGIGGCQDRTPSVAVSLMTVSEGSRHWQSRSSTQKSFQEVNVCGDFCITYISNILVTTVSKQVAMAKKKFNLHQYVYT